MAKKSPGVFGRIDDFLQGAVGPERRRSVQSRRAIRAFERAPVHIQRTLDAMGVDPGQSQTVIKAVDPYTLSATKSINWSQFALDFVNDTWGGGVSYDRQLLENAYRSSVYLFAALRRVAYLFSTIEVLVEVKKGGAWVELGKGNYLASMFERDGPKMWREGYLNFAIYGAALVYKQKSRRAVLAAQRGERDPFSIRNNGIAGFHVIPGSKYSVDEGGASGSIRGFHLAQFEPSVGDPRFLERNECVFVQDYDPEQRVQSMSIVRVALANAITDAAIRQWASHYFTTGAMPMVLITYEDNPARTSEVDLYKQKSFFDRQWRGLGNSLRSIFLDRRVNVEQVGIDADKVAAPELSRNALEGISSATGLAPDLIVPPESGSDNARHKFLMKQSWTDTVIPIATQFLAQMSEDIGLPPHVRISINEDAIAALDADRRDNADTEIAILQGGLESYNEARERMGMKPVRELDDFYYHNGRLLPLSRIVRGGQVDIEALNTLNTAWDSNLLTRGQIHQILGMHMPLDVDDGYKFQIVVEGSGGAALGTEIVDSADPPLETPPKPGELVEKPGGGVMVRKPEAGGDDGPPTPEPPSGGGGKPKPPPKPSQRDSVSHNLPLDPGAKEITNLLPLENDGGRGDSNELPEHLPPHERDSRMRPAIKPVKTPEQLYREDGMVTLPFARTYGSRAGVDWQQVPSPTFRRAFSAELDRSNIAHATATDEALTSAAERAYRQLSDSDPSLYEFSAKQVDDHIGYFAFLDFENEPALATAQALARESVRADEWTSPDEWHCSLLYAMEGAPLTAIRQLGRESLEFAAFELLPESLEIWSTPSGKALVLRVALTESLHRLQAALYEAAVRVGLPVHEFVISSDWKPHITLAYGVADDSDLPSLDGDHALHVQRVLLIAGNQENDLGSVREWRAKKAMQTDAAEELRAWQKVTGSSRQKAVDRFEAIKIPPALAEEIRERLATDENEEVIFEHARHALDQAQADETHITVGLKAWSPNEGDGDLPIDVSAYLRLLVSTTPDAAVDAVKAGLAYWRAAHAGTTKAWGVTESSFRANLFDIVGRFFGIDPRTGDPPQTRNDFARQGRQLIDIYYRAAFIDGLEKAGEENPEEAARQGELADELNEQIKTARSQFGDFADDLYDLVPLYHEVLALRDDMPYADTSEERAAMQQEFLAKLKEFEQGRETFLKRAGMWVTKGVKRLYERGKVLGGARSQRYRWNWNPLKEHCSTCFAANGQVHTMRAWLKNGVLPQGDNLECGGFHCGCELTLTDEKARGRLSRIPVAGSTKANEIKALMPDAGDAAALAKFGQEFWQDDPEMKAAWSMWLESFTAA